MTLLYLKQRIDDELEGAKQYILDAISLKESHPAWAKNFAEMSEIELGHAKKLLDMFNSYYAELFPSTEKGGAPDYHENYDRMIMEDVRADFMHEYTECYTTVLKMHDMFKK